MMKITQFKQMLALYGADVSRWDGADIDEVKELIRSSAAARALYQEAEALDDALDAFTVAPADPAMLGRVMARIGGETEAPASVAKPPSEAPPPPPTPDAFAGWGTQMQGFWLGAVACAVALLVFVGTLDDASQRGGATMGVQSVMLRTPDEPVEPAAPAPTMLAARDIELFMTELNSMVEEEFAEQELIGMLASTDAQSSERLPVQDEEIDAFLDEILPAEDQALQSEMDMWELFLQSNRQAP